MNSLLKTNGGVTESLIFYFFSLECFSCRGVVVACIRKYCLGPTEVSLNFFTSSRYSGPPYDHSITCSAGHLRRLNSNSLHNFCSFNPCHSQSSHHKDVLLSTPPLVPNQMTSKSLCSLRTPCTQSYQAPTFNKPISLLSPFLTYWFSTTQVEVENLSTTRIRQGNLELTAFLHSLDNTRNTKMLYYSHPTSIRQELRTKWYHSSQPWGNNNILFWDDSIAQK